VIELDQAVVVERPREALFAHLVRIEALPTWQPFIRSADVLGDGAVAVGTTFRVVIDGPGKGIEATAEITELLRPARIAIRTLDAPGDLEAECDLEALSESRTELRLKARVTLRGAFRLAEGVVRSRIRREAPEALEKLRESLESAIPEGRASRA
jgi:uncharacterized membrane protein